MSEVYQSVPEDSVPEKSSVQTLSQPFQTEYGIDSIQLNFIRLGRTATSCSQFIALNLVCLGIFGVQNLVSRICRIYRSHNSISLNEECDSCSGDWQSLTAMCAKVFNLVVWGDYKKLTNERLITSYKFEISLRNKFFQITSPKLHLEFELNLQSRI